MVRRRRRRHILRARVLRGCRSGTISPRGRGYPIRQRGGSGRRLIDPAQEAAVELGCTKVEVMSHRTRAAVQSFYRAIGYEDACARSGRFERAL